MTDEQNEEVVAQETESLEEVPQPETQVNLAFDDVVDQVIRGEWGTGQGRRFRLSEAGFDHAAIQKAVVRRTNHLG